MRALPKAIAADAPLRVTLARPGGQAHVLDPLDATTTVCGQRVFRRPETRSVRARAFLVAKANECERCRALVGRRVELGEAAEGLTMRLENARAAVAAEAL